MVRVPSSRWPRRAFAVSVAGLAVAVCAAAALSFAAGLRGTSDTVPPWFPSGPPSRELLDRLPKDVRVDNFGNAWVTRGSGRPHVLVLAHRDAPGWIVSEITHDGYLRVQRLGTGATPLVDQFLVGKRLVVYTQRGPLPAVTVAPSTHFRRGANVPVPEATVDDLWIDVGAESDGEAREMGIALLDVVTPVERDLPPNDFSVDYASGARRACEAVARVAEDGPGRQGSITFAWVGGGSEGARGSRRLLHEFAPFDSVVVVECASHAANDSLARRQTEGFDLDVAPADTNSAASAQWARDWRSIDFVPWSLARLSPTSTDGRVFSEAGIPTVVLLVPSAYAGTPGEVVETTESPESALRTALGIRRVVVPSSQLLGKPVRVEQKKAEPTFGGATRLAWAAASNSMSSGPERPRSTGWRTIAPLLAAYGVSEHESHVAEAVRALLPPGAARTATVDERGNLELRLGDGPPGRLFVAHMDEIGYRVTTVDPDHRGRVERKGGFYDWLYEGEVVRIASPYGPSTVGVVAPRAGYRLGPRPAVVHPLLDEVHATPGAQSRFDVADVRVDGLRTGVVPGADVTVLHEMARLGEHRFTARAIDDRFGCAALILAARELWPERRHLPNAVWLVWSVEEETGLKGATWLADSLAHHGALPIRVHAVDTFVASDSPLENPRIGGARLGKGAVIRAVDTSHEAPLPAVDATLRLAREHDIPLQYGVTAGGNDGVPFAERGSINLPLGWPLRSSHTAVEVADLRDLESLAKLVQVLAEQPARDDPKFP